MSEVIDFVSEVLQREGALIEQTEPGRLETVLPEQLRDRLGLGELAVLTEDDEEDAPEGTVSAGHGTEVLAKIARIALGTPGRVAFGAVDRPHPPARRPKAYTGLNLSLRAGMVEPAVHWFLVGLGRYEATSDDQREGLVRSVVSASGGAPFDLPELEAFPIDRLGREQLPDDLIRSGFARLREAIMAEAVTQLAGFREAVARRHRRDAERVDRYFTDVAEDLKRRMRGRRDTPGLEAKLKALPAERRRRRAQLALNHALQVRVELVGLVAIRGPGLKAALEVRRRKHEVELEVRFDGLANEWVPLRCDGCGRPTYLFAMCDEAAHVLCDDCWEAAGTGGHRPCFRCEGKPLRPYWLKQIKQPHLVRAAAAKPAPAAPAASEPAKPAPPEPAPPKAKPAPPKAKPKAKPAPPKAKPAPVRRPRPRATTTPAERRAKLQQDVISVLLDGGRPLTSPEIREEVKVSADKLRDILAPLVEKGLVGKQGQRRGTRYFWRGKGR